MQIQELSPRLSPGYEGARPTSSTPPTGGHRTRRRRITVSTVAVVVGSFMLVVAVLLPLYVYPRMASLPEDPQDGATLTADDATMLIPDATSPTGARILEHANATSTTYVSGVPDAAGPNSVVWRFATQVFVSGHGLVNAQIEQASFDRRTAEPTNCCGDKLVTDSEDSEGRALNHRGYIVWPFNVQKRSYELWDLNMEGTKTAKFEGVETRNGLTTYRFRSTVPKRTVGTIELPGGFFGNSAPSVRATALYSDTSTYWVEPASGAVIFLRDQISRQFSYGGKTITAFAGTLVTAETPADRLTQLRRAALILPLLRGRAPWVLVAFGCSLIILGGWLTRTRARRLAAQPQH